MKHIKCCGNFNKNQWNLQNPKISIKGQLSFHLMESNVSFIFMIYAVHPVCGMCLNLNSFTEDSFFYNNPQKNISNREHWRRRWAPQFWERSHVLPLEWESECKRSSLHSNNTKHTQMQCSAIISIQTEV